MVRHTDADDDGSLSNKARDALEDVSPDSPYWSEVRYTVTDHEDGVELSTRKDKGNLRAFSRRHEDALDEAGLEWHYKEDGRFRDGVNNRRIVVTGTVDEGDDASIDDLSDYEPHRTTGSWSSNVDKSEPDDRLDAAEGATVEDAVELERKAADVGVDVETNYLAFLADDASEFPAGKEHAANAQARFVAGVDPIDEALEAGNHAVKRRVEDGYAGTDGTDEVARLRGCYIAGVAPFGEYPPNPGRVYVDDLPADDGDDTDPDFDLTDEDRERFEDEFDGPTDEEFERTFDAIGDVAERYDISKADAEAFLEDAGYFGDPDDPDLWADGGTDEATDEDVAEAIEHAEREVATDGGTVRTERDAYEPSGDVPHADDLERGDDVTVEAVPNKERTAAKKNDDYEAETGTLSAKVVRADIHTLDAHDGVDVTGQTVELIAEGKTYHVTGTGHLSVEDDAGFRVDVARDATMRKVETDGGVDVDEDAPECESCGHLTVGVDDGGEGIERKCTFCGCFTDEDGDLPRSDDKRCGKCGGPVAYGPFKDARKGIRGYWCPECDLIVPTENEPPVATDGGYDDVVVTTYTIDGDRETTDPDEAEAAARSGSEVTARTQKRRVETDGGTDTAEAPQDDALFTSLAMYGDVDTAAVAVTVEDDPDVVSSVVNRAHRHGYVVDESRDATDDAHPVERRIRFKRVADSDLWGSNGRD